MPEIIEVITPGETIVIEPLGEIVEVLHEVVEVIEVAEQGLPGRPGVPGQAGGATAIFTALSAIGGHRVLTMTPAGELAYASNDDLTAAGRIVGVSLNAASPGGDVSVQRGGEVSEPSWNLDTDLPVYLGVNGLLTQTPPESPAVFSLIVGFPMTPTKLFVSIREPIYLT